MESPRTVGLASLRTETPWWPTTPNLQPPLQTLPAAKTQRTQTRHHREPLSHLPCIIYSLRSYTTWLELWGSAPAPALGSDSAGGWSSTPATIPLLLLLPFLFAKPEFLSPFLLAFEVPDETAPDERAAHALKAAGDEHFHMGCAGGLTSCRSQNPCLLLAQLAAQWHTEHCTQNLLDSNRK